MMIVDHDDDRRLFSDQCDDCYYDDDELNRSYDKCCWFCLVDDDKIFRRLLMKLKKIIRIEAVDRNFHDYT